jgi:two-component system LytT family sensor kinase
VFAGWCWFVNYFSAMRRSQLIATYAILIFIMVWGFDLINAVKYNTPVTTRGLFSLYNFSQITYALATLLLTRWVFRRLYLTKKYALLAISVIGLFVFFIAFRYTLEEIVNPAIFGVHNYRSDVSLVYYTLDNIYYATLYIALGISVFFVDAQVGNQKKQALLEEQNRNAEMQFLRSQINPHFLFNSLNNIYTLVYEQSAKAPQAVLKLSELIRYMLYEKKDKVPLLKEWEYVQNFIGLQQLRFDRDVPVTTELKGDAGTVSIPPYLLIPFAENAFKHGDFSDPSSPLVFKVEVKDRAVIFKTENKINHHNKEQSGGVGLSNVRKRLELLYPGKHSLDITMDNAIFKAQLRLNN